MRCRFFADNFNQFRVAFKFDVVHLCFGNLSNYVFVVWCNHLSAIIPVSFVTVVFFRVVRSRKYNSTLTA